MAVKHELRNGDHSSLELNLLTIHEMRNMQGVEYQSERTKKAEENEKLKNFSVRDSGFGLQKLRRNFLKIIYYQIEISSNFMLF